MWQICLLTSSLILLHLDLILGSIDGVDGIISSLFFIIYLIYELIIILW